MWTMVVGAAVAAEISVEQAQGLGLPRRHEVGAGGGTLVLAWADGAGDTVLTLPRERVATVLHRAEAGVHDLGVRLSGGEELWIERGPCPVVSAMADTYVAFLRVPVEGSGEAEECVDVAAEALAWQLQHVPKLNQAQWTEVPFAGILVADRRGRPVLAVQRGLASSRPWVGSCFETGPDAVERHVILTTIILPDGAMDKLVVVGQADAVSDCVLERIGSARLTELPEKKAKVTLDVDWTPPAPPQGVPATAN